MAIDEVDPQIQIAFAHEGSAQPSDNCVDVTVCCVFVHHHGVNTHETNNEMTEPQLPPDEVIQPCTT